MLEGKLDDASVKEVYDHIDKCPDCRTKLERLQNYKNLVSKIESVDVPDDLKTSIWKSLEKENQKNPSSSPRVLSPTHGIIIATLAASVLLLLTLKPFSPGLLRIDSSYFFIVEKKGKGPGENRTYTEGSDTRIDRLLLLADSAGVNEAEPFVNEKSGRIDYIKLRIPTDNYLIFRDLYNNEPGADSLLPLSGDYKRKHIVLQVYIPGRRFITGDFNGDSYIDFGVYFDRGKYPGRIFISLNDSSGNFLPHRQININNEKIYLDDGDNIISGDFNGDGYDDLMVRSQNGPEASNLAFYINMGQGEFENKFEFIPTDSILTQDIWNKFLAGDIDGDGFDDLVVVYYKGKLKGRFIVALNKQDGSFKPPYLMNTCFGGMKDNEKFSPLLMDINGDGLSDPGIYWQSGERDAYWYFIHNNPKEDETKEFYAGFGKGHMAFMGNYIPYTGDANADGYDELLVKLGTSDEVADWYLMLNRHDSTFAMGKPILFDGKPDLMIR